MAYMVEKQYEDGQNRDQPLECALMGEDLNGRRARYVKVRGLRTSWALKNNVTSGETTIYANNGAEIDYSSNELIVPSNSSIKVSFVMMNSSRCGNP